MESVDPAVIAALKDAGWVVCGTLVVLSVLKTIRVYIVKRGSDTKEL